MKPYPLLPSRSAPPSRGWQLSAGGAVFYIPARGDAAALFRRKIDSI
eukprot:COSAG06_NODE_52601_length_304_cov_3.053659_1_plen_47_part_01